MGTQDGERKGAGAGGVAAFDFDGTLTTRDSFGAFLAWRAGPFGTLAGGLRLISEALTYLALRDRGRFKGAAAKVFLGGMTRAELARACEAFAAEAFDRLVRPDARACWEDWRAKGAVLAIVSASPEEVVGPFARRLGADVLLASRLRYDSDGRVAGGLDGENCRGPEKVRRLEQEFGEGLRLVAAYGDTSGDREMLEIADKVGFRQFTARP